MAETWEDVAERLEAFSAAVANGEIHLNPEYWVGQFTTLVGLADAEFEHRPAPVPNFATAAGNVPQEIPSWLVQLLESNKSLAAKVQELAAAQQAAVPAEPEAKPTAAGAARRAGLPTE